VLHELTSNDIPLGIDRHWKYEKSEAVVLPPDTLLIFFSDGILEAFPFGRNQFGPVRALNLVNSHRHSTSSEMLEHLYAEVSDFTKHQPQSDDMTAIICKVNGDVQISVFDSLSRETNNGISTEILVMSMMMYRISGEIHPT
jgi:serine phosphatase RsbU (regulator of sigma subunit)